MNASASIDSRCRASPPSESIAEYTSQHTGNYLHVSSRSVHRLVEVLLIHGRYFVRERDDDLQRPENSDDEADYGNVNAAARASRNQLPSIWLNGSTSVGISARIMPVSAIA